MDSKPLDEIMSERNSEPATEPSTEPQQARDEHGRFARPPAEAPEPPAEQPAQAQPEPAAAKPERGMVPQPALHAAREGERAERERADRLERELAELRGQVSVLTQPKPEPKPEPKKVDYWEDPDGYFRQQLSPLQGEMQALASEFSYEMASGKHGEETVKAAVSSLKAAREAGTLDPADAQKIMRSRFPFQEIVKWHQRTSTLTEVGDIATFKEKMRAEILAEIQAQSAAQPPQPAAQRPVMPTAFATARSDGPRTAVVHSGPRPLSEIMAR